VRPPPQGSLAQRPAPERPPNVLLITTDQQRRDTLGCYGNPVIRTPHLDSLAAGGIRFDRAYVTNPVCTPSRATLLTGRYPSSHGAYNVGVPLPEDVPTLSAALDRAGYDTALIGKAHFQPFGADPARFVESNRGPKRDRALWRDWHGPYYGFRHVELSIGHGPGGTEGHYGEWLRQTAPEVLDLFPRTAALSPSTVPVGSWKSAVPVEYHSTTWTARRTIARLEQLASPERGGGTRPFFIWTSFQDPHHPFCPPRPYCDLYAPEDVPLPRRRAGELEALAPHFRHAYGGRQGELPYAGGRLSGTDPGGYAGMTEAHARETIAHYYGMVTLVDDAVGEIQAALDRLGLARDTVVVFATDHGELLGDHGLWLKGPFLYESLICVPYLWRFPAGFSAGRVVPGVASYLDFAPTILDLAGLLPDPHMQGASMLPLLRGDVGAAPRGHAMVELREDLEGLQSRTIVTDRHKLTCYPGHDFGELFHLQEDPHELHNRWEDGTHAPIREALLRRLVGSMADSSRPLIPRVCYA